MEKRSVIAGSACLTLAVAFGAFGAHALKAKLGPAELEVWRTGVDYQFYHGLGILLVAALGEHVSARAAQWAGRLFLIGILFFCGSLYVLSTKELTGLGGAAAFIGPITPLGGLCFMAGWFVILVSVWRRKALP